MSKYIDTFADDTSSSVAPTVQLSQSAGATKKKIKIDASLLDSLNVSTALLVGLNDHFYKGETDGKGCEQVGSKQDTCTTPGSVCKCP